MGRKSIDCGSGGRVTPAGKALRDVGFEDVRNVGRFRGMVAAGLKIEKG
jgi:hypothetical protein